MTQKLSQRTPSGLQGTPQMRGNSRCFSHRYPHGCASTNIHTYMYTYIFRHDENVTQTWYLLQVDSCQYTQSTPSTVLLPNVLFSADLHRICQPKVVRFKTNHKCMQACGLHACQYIYIYIYVYMYSIHMYRQHRLPMHLY